MDALTALSWIDPTKIQYNWNTVAAKYHKKPCTDDEKFYYYGGCQTLINPVVRTAADLGQASVYTGQSYIKNSVATYDHFSPIHHGPSHGNSNGNHVVNNNIHAPKGKHKI